ncbi:MAG: DUF2207 domain-containing protein [Chloroflexi bacterium]|nr:MAG: DUF2207 domain-containing protein [Chloroflexota bacterium]
MTFARAPLVATIALVLALAQPTAATADEGWTIERFAADITIRPDASLHVVETIDVNFGGLERHGIFRTIPVRYKVDDTHVRVYRLSVTSVTDATDRAVPYAATDQGGYRVVKLGDANRLVSGRQTYRVTYDLARACTRASSARSSAMRAPRDLASPAGRRRLRRLPNSRRRARSIPASSSPSSRPFRRAQSPSPRRSSSGTATTR